MLDRNGRGKDSDVIDAIEKIIARNAANTAKDKARNNISVINLSPGRPVYESFRLDPLCKAVEAAWTSGIVVVVSAGNHGREDSYGNDGYGTITSPGNHRLVMTVGAQYTLCVRSSPTWPPDPDAQGGASGVLGELLAWACGRYHRQEWGRLLLRDSHAKLVF